MIDFQAQGLAIVKRIQEAEEGFRNTFVDGKMYSDEEMEIKNIWLKQSDAAKRELSQWFSKARRQ
jgi:hypothetical protein